MGRVIPPVMTRVAMLATESGPRTFCAFVRVCVIQFVFPLELLRHEYKIQNDKRYIRRTPSSKQLCVQSDKIVGQLRL